MPGFEEINSVSLGSAKKPLFAFKLQKSASKLKTNLQGSVKEVFLTDSDQASENIKSKLSLPLEGLQRNINNIQDKETQFSYTEPPWSGTPEDEYRIEILKSGVILNSLLLSKNYYVIGRSSFCDITLFHDTISEFHAVLQHRKVCDSNYQKGLYVYDFNTEHGTFINGKKIKPHEYILLYSGYIIHFGDSQKRFILQTSKDNEEREAELSAVELKNLKKLESEEQKKLEQENLLKEKEKTFLKSKESINWGIAEDTDESSRMTVSSENSESTDEELFISDPKKALRDWFKWEGYDLEYQTEDRGSGQYSCSIDLTLDPVGTKETIKVNVFGEKMKAIDECALKACKFLNRFGLLRQAHEEKKSTVRNWEDVDYYDSDEDNFLDRTGVVEKKRHRRMKLTGKFDAQIETHNSLMKKQTEILERIETLEKLIALQSSNQGDEENTDEDALDAFMAKLDTSTLDKTEIRNMKIELHNLRKEELLVRNSINVNQSVTPGSSQYSSSWPEPTKNRCRFDMKS